VASGQFPAGPGRARPVKWARPRLSSLLIKVFSNTFQHSNLIIMKGVLPVLQIFSNLAWLQITSNKTILSFDPTPKSLQILNYKTQK
jgi:hypothetical protein